MKLNAPRTLTIQTMKSEDITIVFVYIKLSQTEFTAYKLHLYAHIIVITTIQTKQIIITLSEFIKDFMVS